MNKNIIFYFLSLLLFSSCDEMCQDCVGDGNYPTKATVFYINETSDLVVSYSGETRISPGDTLVSDFDSSLGGAVNKNSFPVSVLEISTTSMYYQEGTSLKCENGIYDIQNYEDRKELEPFVFEFTFRFTEEKKAKAMVGGCH